MVRPYFVCTTPRSGSTLLCEALALTGVAGRPAEYFEALAHSNRPRQPHEYFDGVRDPLIGALLPAGPTCPVVPELAHARRYEDYLHWVRAEATTPNGVLGVKLMWGHLGDLVDRLGGDRRMPLGTLEAEFPGARYVRVRRPNKPRQAISLWKALQTQRWRDDGIDGSAEERSPAYHFGAIDHLVIQLTRHEAAWDELFDQAGIAPVTLTFDEIADDLPDAVQRVLSFLDVDSRGIAPVLPGMRRQADLSSLEWLRRYMEEREQRHAQPVG
ncbi:MAG: Stf0 family sulfotransferase [Solirubrobacterales bacterium]